MAAALASTLTITVPDTANLGSALPGDTISASLGTVTVDDSRFLIAGWTATVSATNFTTGGGTAAETISKSAVAYWSGTTTAFSGISILSPGQPTAAQRVPLSGTVTAFSGTKVAGTTSASWAPKLVVSVPSAALAGTYTGTITHAVA
jgi:hypothetical protein